MTGIADRRGAERPVVIYIGGSGRCGSTLLERLLGEVDGVTALGEVVHLPTRGLLEGQPCACGQPLDTCPFWGPVGDEGFGGWDRVDGDDWQQLQRRVDRNRHLARLTVPVSASVRADLRAHLDRIGRLYRAAATVSGAPILVDSSKHASTAFILRHAATVDIDVVFVHLVRDSRGVAHSWTKEVARPETDDGQPMPRYSTPSAAAWWDGFNIALSSLPLLGTRTLRLRYEDLLAEPAQALRTILDRAGHPLPDDWDEFLDADGATLGTSHSVAGNPMRFRTGTVPLRTDDAWRTALPARDRRAVTAITAPLLLAYGYMGRPPQPMGHRDSDAR